MPDMSFALSPTYVLGICSIKPVRESPNDLMRWILCHLTIQCQVLVSIRTRMTIIGILYILYILYNIFFSNGKIFCMTASFPGKCLSLGFEAGFKALVRPVTLRLPPPLTTVCSASCMSPRPRLNIPSVGYMLEKRLRAPDMGWINTQSLFLLRVHWLFLRMALYWSGNMFHGHVYANF